MIIEFFSKSILGGGRVSHAARTERLISMNVVNRGIKNRMIDAVIYIILLILALSCLIPVYHIFVLSLSDKYAIAANRVTFWPIGFQTYAYERIFTDGRTLRAMMVSVGRTVIGTVLNMIILVLAAYPLSLEREELKGRDFLMWFLYIPAFFGGGLIPTYLQMKNLHLVNNPLVLIINGGLFTVGNSIILLNFFRNLPKGLSESAKMDGATHFDILFRIFIPLSKASLATLTLFNMVGLWNEWFNGMIYLNDMDWYPLQTLLQQKISNPIDPTKMTKEELELAMKLSDRTLISAQIFVSTVPIMLVYPFLQKYFMTGIVLGSVKE